jgi:hypothetical protein
MGKSDELDKLLSHARKHGWRLEGGNTGGKKQRHWKCLSPDGKTIVVLPTSASDYRSLKNARAALKRSGLEGL